MKIINPITVLQDKEKFEEVFKNNIYDENGNIEQVDKYENGELVR